MDLGSHEEREEREKEVFEQIGLHQRSGRCSRTSFPEGSASASALAGRWRAIPN